MLKLIKITYPRGPVYIYLNGRIRLEEAGEGGGGVGNHRPVQHAPERHPGNGEGLPDRPAAGPARPRARSLQVQVSLRLRVRLAWTQHVSLQLVVVVVVGGGMRVHRARWIAVGLTAGLRELLYLYRGAARAVFRDRRRCCAETK